MLWANLWVVVHMWLLSGSFVQSPRSEPCMAAPVLFVLIMYQSKVLTCRLLLSILSVFSIEPGDHLVLAEVTDMRPSGCGF